MNHVEQTASFVEFAKIAIGEENVSSQDLPIPASEDFSFFLESKPGCFFFLGTGNFEKFLHTSSYDYNDEMVIYGAVFWAKFIENKLQLKFN